MRLLTLKTRRFRNLADADVVWDGGTTLVLGGNGQGKSNLLEAVSVLGTIRSFRSASPRQMVRHGEQSFLLEGRLEGEDGEVVLSQLVETGPPVRRELCVNNGRVQLSAYLEVFPVVALTGNDRELVEGPPAVRRSFLDRLCFHLDPSHLADLRTYQRSLRQRNAALARSAGDAELEAWEQRLAIAAAAVHVRRATALNRLQDAFDHVYRRLRGETFPTVEMSYRGESWTGNPGDPSTVAQIYRSRYNETRARDRLAGFTGEGPHRHDVALRADGRLGRDVLSSGQT